MKQVFKFENNRYILILLLVLFVQIIGYTMYINANGSAIGKTLWLNAKLHDQLAYGIDFYLCVFSIPLLIFGFLKKSAWPFYFCFFWLGVMSFLTWYQGGSFSAPYSLFAHNNRYMLPACLAFWIHSKSPANVTFSGISHILTLSIAMVFITHGIEALNKNPIFIDYTLRFFRNYTPFWLEEKHARLFLVAVGIQDILLALAVLWKPHKWVFVYMAFWGFWTAILRIFYSPDYGLASTVMRAANGGVPLVLFLQFLKIKGFPPAPENSAIKFFTDIIKDQLGKVKP